MASTKRGGLNWAQLKSRFITDLVAGFILIWTMFYIVVMYRAFMFEFHPVVIVYTGLYLMSLPLYFFRSRIPENLAVLILISILTVAYSVAIYSYAIIATGTLIYASFSGFILAFLYRIKIAILYMAFVATIYFLIAYRYVSGNLILVVAVDEEARQISKWVNDFFAYFAVVCFFFFLVSRIQRALRDQVDVIEKQNLEIEYLANHDQLTGLPTVRLSQDRADMAMKFAKREGKQSAILFLDLDGFKVVNDKFGHDAGDQILITVAKRLQEELRESDSACRIGGDEFLIVLTSVGGRTAIEDVCRRLINKIGTPIIYEGNNLVVGVSIGGAIYPEHGDTFEALRTTADNAMYNVKKSGKNAFIIAT